MPKVIATAREILNAPVIGSWDVFCEKRGISPYAVNDGQMDDTEEFSLTVEEARSYGLLPKGDE